jgi:hypothetical protein
VQWLLNGRRFSQLAPNEEGIKEGKIKGDLNHKCMLEVGMFDNAPMPIRSSKPPLILLSFNLMLCAATSTTLNLKHKKIKL